MKVRNYYEDYEVDDDEKECPICNHIYSIPLNKMVRCKTCGAYFESEDKWEHWDQSQYDYTDERLKWFARDATEWLLKEEWEEVEWDYNNNLQIIVHDYDLGEWGNTTHNFVAFDSSNTRATINYSLPTLRNKKQCLHSVAHETAHVSPAIIINRYHIEALAPYELLTGHFTSWQEKMWDNKRKLKRKYPKYKWD